MSGRVCRERPALITWMAPALGAKLCSQGLGAEGVHAGGAPTAQPFAKINVPSPKMSQGGGRGVVLIPGMPPPPGTLSPLLPEAAQWGDGELAQWGDRDAVSAPDPVPGLRHPPRERDQQQAGLAWPEPAVPSQRPGTAAPTSPWRHAWHLGVPPPPSPSRLRWLHPTRLN